jgi:site-specific DNA-adenine methylase
MLIDGTFTPYNPSSHQQLEDDYLYYKNLKDTDSNDPMIAYWGHGMCFGGRWFNTLVRNGREHRKGGRLEGIDCEFSALSNALEVNRSVIRDQEALSKIRNLELMVSDYQELQIPKGSFVYLDSPYAPFNAREDYFHKIWDNNKYWDWVREVSTRFPTTITNTSYPPDFEVLHNWGDTSTNWRSNPKGQRTELKKNPEVLLRYKYGY